MRRAALVVAAALTAGCQHMSGSPLADLQAPPALPETQGTYLNMGRHLLAQGQLDVAHDAFIRSIRVEGASAAALTGAGLASERRGLLNDARRYFTRAVRVAPSSVLAYNNLGAVHYRLGEYHEAKQAFQAAFALSSGTNAVAAQNLALAERAILRVEQEGLEIVDNPVPLQRLGTGEYTLGQPAGTGTEG